MNIDECNKRLKAVCSELVADGATFETLDAILLSNWAFCHMRHRGMKADVKTITQIEQASISVADRIVRRAIQGRN